MRILVSGFEPWDGWRFNASWVAVEPLEGSSIAGAEVKAISLPVERDSSMRLLQEAAAAFKPHAVACFGMLSKGPAVWRVEVLAHNRDKFGEEIRPITEDAPAFLASGLPVARIHGRLLDAGLPVQFSETAGEFVCNHLFYRAMTAAEEGRLPLLTGFIHVPPPVEPEGPDDDPANAEQLREGARMVVEAIAAGGDTARR